MTDTAATPVLSTTRILRNKLQPNHDGIAAVTWPGIVADSWVAMDLSGDVSAFALVEPSDVGGAEITTSQTYALVRTGQYPLKDALRVDTLIVQGAITHVFLAPNA